jgi:hypothetical protein
MMVDANGKIVGPAAKAERDVARQAAESDEAGQMRGDDAQQEISR